MKDLNDTIACVVDMGIYFPVAERLSRDVKKVYYHIPSTEAFETFAMGSRGYGHGKVELLEDFWRIKKQIDVFVFPDAGGAAYAGLQLELQSQGFPVWGSKDAADLERKRGSWIEKCEELGLPMPRTHRIKGLTNAWLFFQEHEGETFFVKVSRWRGDMETWRADELAQIRNKLDLLRLKWGPLAESMILYVQENLDTDIEGGADTYFVNGQYPDKIILGYEKKGESYFGVVKDRADMPPEIWSVNEKATDLLASFGYANMISTEVRVQSEQEKSFWLDPCLRFPSPAGEEELEIYKNFSEIIVRGAHGELVQPEIEEEFCGEAVIEYNGDKDGWKSFVVPEEVRQWVKLYACVYHDGAYHFNPQTDPEALGCAVALGDKPQDVIDGLKAIQEALKNAPVCLHIEPLADLLIEIQSAEEQGIEFTDEKMPDPSEVLDS